MIVSLVRLRVIRLPLTKTNPNVLFGVLIVLKVTLHTVRVVLVQVKEEYHVEVIDFDSFIGGCRSLELEVLVLLTRDEEPHKLRDVDKHD